MWLSVSTGIPSGPGRVSRAIFFVGAICQKLEIIKRTGMKDVLEKTEKF